MVAKVTAKGKYHRTRRIQGSHATAQTRPVPPPSEASSTAKHSRNRDCDTLANRMQMPVKIQQRDAAYINQHWTQSVAKNARAYAGRTHRRGNQRVHPEDRTLTLAQGHVLRAVRTRSL